MNRRDDMNIEELIERRCKRLEELSDAITSKDGWESVHREFTMRIPADEDRDADLVLYWAAKTLREQQAEIERLRALITDELTRQAQELDMGY